MKTVSRMIARPQLWTKPWKNFSSHRIGRDSNAKRHVDRLVEVDLGAAAGSARRGAA